MGAIVSRAAFDAGDHGGHNKSEGSAPSRTAPPPPKGPYARPDQGSRRGNRGKGKGKDNNKGKGKGKNDPRYKDYKFTTPEGKQICFRYNQKKDCDGRCGMAHCCQRCFGKHPALECPGAGVQ